MTDGVPTVPPATLTTVRGSKSGSVSFASTLIVNAPVPAGGCTLSSAAVGELFGEPVMKLRIEPFAP